MTMRSQFWPISSLPGLKPPEQKLLQAQGINSTQDLLAQTQTLAARRALASKLQLNLKHVQKWCSLADLARIPSVGDRYCGLLLHAGIISVEQLAQTPWPRLHQQIVRLQVATTRRPDLAPSLELVKSWTEQAAIITKALKNP